SNFISTAMQLDEAGALLSHRFTRGLMTSPAALNYEEVQAAIDGAPNERTAPLFESVLRPLYGVYAALSAAREARQPLDLDLPERRIELSPLGKVTSVAFKERLDAHRLIEECMVLANVAAAKALTAKREPLIFRVHEEPSPEKLDALRETAASVGLPLAKGQVLKTSQLNRLLGAAQGTEMAEMISIATLRSMTQAYYSPENFGHFGLALSHYAHFTSPIRRYADLVVQRALIAAHGWEERARDDTDLDAVATHISETERRSMLAERDTNDRYLAAYLSERVGNEFTGRISGISRAGVFVKLDGTGANGLVPMRELGREYFHYDPDAVMLTGADTGREISLGQRVTARLAEAVAVTGGLKLELLDIDGTELSRGPAPRRAKPPKRKLKASKGKASKLRKVTRRKR
ncbi:MAG: RNB domain-containing ribonuclease, partial [Pseudomonadota bacterium]